MTTKLQEHIFLIGFMGVGKTTVSHILSQKLGVRELDTDAMIVEKEGQGIPAIFQEKGETYFRTVETQVMETFGQREPCIVSCGGGVVKQQHNVEIMKPLGKIVLLTATPETIYEHVKEGKDRPLLNGNMNIPYIRKLMEEREQMYQAAADLQIKTDGMSPEQIANKICEMM